jgi:effector-associated domain 7 (EAD7)-containing protein
VGSQTNVARNLEQLSQVAQETGNIEEARDLDERSKWVSERLKAIAPLREVLKNEYTIDDLRDISSHLGLDWESLPGESHNAKVTELVTLAYGKGKAKELQDILRTPLT